MQQMSVCFVISPLNYRGSPKNRTDRYAAHPLYYIRRRLQDLFMYRDRVRPIDLRPVYEYSKRGMRIKERRKKSISALMYNLRLQGNEILKYRMTE